MIPYFAQPEVQLGPVTIHTFGVLVACALLVGTTIVRHRAAAEGLPEREVGRFLSWILLGGFAGAHLVDRLVYFPTATIADPLSVLRFWESLSSLGGFLGGTVGALLFFRKHAAAGSSWKYIDSFAYAFPFAWVLGRAGCFVAYDHPGRPTGFVLGGALDARLCPVSIRCRLPPDRGRTLRRLDSGPVRMCRDGDRGDRHPHGSTTPQRANSLAIHRPAQDATA